MSWNLYIIPFRNGKLSSFDRSLIHEIFGSDGVIARDGKIEYISYANGESAEVYGTGAQTIERGMSFSRIRGERVGEGIWRLADRTGALIIWPDVPPRPHCAATNADIIPHVPPEVIEGMGPVKIVKSGKELSDYISRPL
jgi:hypothetical protein